MADNRPTALWQTSDGTWNLAVFEDTAATVIETVATGLPDRRTARSVGAAMIEAPHASRPDVVAPRAGQADKAEALDALLPHAGNTVPYEDAGAAPDGAQDPAPDAGGEQPDTVGHEQDKDEPAPADQDQATIRMAGVVAAYLRTEQAAEAVSGRADPGAEADLTPYLDAARVRRAGPGSTHLVTLPRALARIVHAHLEDRLHADRPGVGFPRWRLERAVRMIAQDLADRE